MFLPYKKWSISNCCFFQTQKPLWSDWISFIARNSRSKNSWISRNNSSNNWRKSDKPILTTISLCWPTTTPSKAKSTPLQIGCWIFRNLILERLRRSMRLRTSKWKVLWRRLVGLTTSRNPMTRGYRHDLWRASLTNISRKQLTSRYLRIRKQTMRSLRAPNFYWVTARKRRWRRFISMLGP